MSKLDVFLAIILVLWLSLVGLGWATLIIAILALYLVCRAIHSVSVLVGKKGTICILVASIMTFVLI